MWQTTENPDEEQHQAKRHETAENHRTSAESRHCDHFKATSDDIHGSDENVKVESGRRAHSGVFEELNGVSGHGGPRPYLTGPGEHLNLGTSKVGTFPHVPE